MSTQQGQSGSLASNFRGLPLARGESVVFTAGLAIGAVVLGILVASSWWTLRTYRGSLEKGRTQELRTTAMLLSEAVSGALAESDLTAVRKLVVDGAAQADLTVCRVELLDGSVVADIDSSKISVGLLKAIPEQLPSGRATEDTEQHTEGAIHHHANLSIAGRGDAVLELEGSMRFPLLADWEVQAGIGAIGVAGMCGLLGAYRLMRRRLRGLGAIAEALRVSSNGEAAIGLLRVSEAFGREAVSWNSLLEEREALREQVLMQKAAEKVHSRSGRDGDLAGAFDAMWSGFIIVDESGKVSYANGAASVLLRRKREEIIGSELMPIVGDPAAEPVLAVAAGKSRQRTSVELERQSEKGERTVLRLTARPMRREDQASAVVLIEDITQQRVADESRNAFVAQATHELRTPLTNIRLYVETMVEEGETDALIRTKCINVIGNEARRLERIVGDMLSVSEIEAGSLKIHEGEIRLDAMFEELEADFKAQAEDKELRLNFAMPPKLPVMQGDRDKLMLALHNLVGNALKYTPVGGEVNVRVEAGQSLTVDVTDNGIGISPDEQELIFEKFYRAKDRRIAGITGSGIGLALARQVVRMHGGDITVSSQIDKGSTFRMAVPLAPGAAVPLKAAA